MPSNRACGCASTWNAPQEHKRIASLRDTRATTELRDTKENTSGYICSYKLAVSQSQRRTGNRFREWISICEAQSSPSQALALAPSVCPTLYKAGGFKLMALSSLTPFDIEATKNNNNKLVILGKTLWMKQNPAKFALISAQNKQTNTQTRDRDPDSQVSVAVCRCLYLQMYLQQSAASASVPCYIFSCRWTYFSLTHRILWPGTVTHLLP